MDPSSLRVLVVDDEPYIGTLLVRLLRSRCAVKAVSSGRRALELIRSGEGVDVVLCDLHMPDVDGMQLHAELERTHRALARRVVFMTGGVDNNNEARAFLEAIDNPHLEKPFDIEEMRRVVFELGRAERLSA